MQSHRIVLLPQAPKHPPPHVSPVLAEYGRVKEFVHAARPVILGVEVLGSKVGNEMKVRFERAVDRMASRFARSRQGRVQDVVNFCEEQLLCQPPVSTRKPNTKLTSPELLCVLKTICHV